MIDTVRFLIPAQKDFHEKIKNFFTETTKVDLKNDLVVFRFYTCDISLGSHDRHINLFRDDIKNCYYLELSLPKFYYGHNIFLLYFDSYKKAITDLYYALIDHFGVFPPVSEWSYQRIDVCYAWKFRSQEQAELMLSYLKTFRVPRKSQNIYPTSFMWQGKGITYKFYLKQDEFYRHDLKDFKKNFDTIEKGYSLYDYASGVLRFETTLRKSALQQYLGEDLRFHNVKEQDITYLLHTFFTKFMKYKNLEVMTAKQVISRLMSTYKKTKAIQLYTFFRAYHSPNQEERDILYNTYSRSQINRNINSIRDAGVGLCIPETDPDFSLNIPSPFVINSDDEAPASSSSSGDSNTA